MKILVINQYFPPDSSGTAYMLGQLAEDLARVHEVTVVAGTPSYAPGANHFRPQGVRVLRVRSTSFSRGHLLGRLCNYLTFASLSAWKGAFGVRPDVVVTMTDPPFIGIVGVCAALRHGVPFALICHDVFPDIAIAMGRMRNRGVIGIWRLLNRLMRWRAARILVVGRDMVERLSSQGVDPRKLTYVPTWANPQTIDPEAIRGLRERYGWSGRFVVMHAGNAGLAQNLGILADLAEQVQGSPEIEIVVLGDGPGKPPLEQMIAQRRLGNLKLLPMLPRQRAQALMAAADLHVISLVPGLWGCATPSKTYGIMAAGRPFVAAVDRGSEPARLAEELGCGHWVPAGDAQALAEAVRQLRSAPLDTMGQRGRAAFEQRFTRSLITAQTAKVLEELPRAD